jgi:hypothetical protein
MMELMVSMKNANTAKRYLKYVPSSCTAPRNQSNLEMFSQD